MNNTTNQQQLFCIDSNGTRCALTITAAQEYINDTNVTDNDITIAVDALEKSMTTDALDRLILAAMDDLTTAAEGSDLPLLVKLYALAMYAVKYGYCTALTDMQAVQRATVEQIMSDHGTTPRADAGESK